MTHGRSTLTQPLVTRPGRSHPRIPVAESGLPGGGPSDKGLPVEPGIPGTRTFDKSVEDIRDFDRSTDTPPERRDGPDDMHKDRDRVDTKEDWSEPHDGIGEMGKGKWDTTIKTKYPYRDDRPHRHNASAEVILGLYQLRFARVVRLRPGVERTAARLDDILTGLNPKVQDKADQCSVQVRRVDAPNLRWIFAVNCGNGAKVVKIKAHRKGAVVKLTKMELDLSCSCPAWRWLGPEYHAQSEDYLDGRPRGTASTPDIKDPEKHNRVCKHVAAVLGHIQTWEVPSGTKG